MDRFVEEENVRRYRKLRDRGATEAQRAMILKQLSKELEHFRCEIAEATSFVRRGGLARFAERCDVKRLDGLVPPFALSIQQRLSPGAKSSRAFSSPRPAT
jgi:hypothetical protein